MDISGISSSTIETAQSILMARKALQAQQMEGLAAVKLIMDSKTSSNSINIDKNGNHLDIYA